jgi:hypothetical protein
MENDAIAYTPIAASAMATAPKNSSRRTFIRLDPSDD